MDPRRTTPEADVPTLLYRRDKNSFDGLEDMPVPDQPLPPAELGTTTQPIQRDPPSPSPAKETPPANVEPVPAIPLGTVTQPLPLDHHPRLPASATPPTTADATTSESAAGTPCPRCGSKLINPGSLGWCPKCGYCRSLEQAGGTMALTAAPGTDKASPLGMVEFGQMLSKLPTWLWVLLAGMGILVVFSLSGNYFLPKNSLPRALWSSVQLAVGLVVLIAAQAWAVILIAPGDDHIGPKDVVFSARLWGLVFRRLPDTRKQLWLGAWGLSAMICAVLLVGGFEYWYQFYQPKKYAEKNLIAAAVLLAKGKEDAKELAESLEDFANKQDLTKQKEKDDGKDHRPTVQCLVIGYKIGEKKQLDGLVLAEERDGRFRYVGVVQQGFTPELSKELLGRLAPLVRPEPLIRDLNFAAIWVSPGVFCEIHQSGYDEQGHLKGPRFGNLLEVEK